MPHKNIPLEKENRQKWISSLSIYSYLFHNKFMLRKLLKWTAIVIFAGYVALVIYRGFVLRGEEATNEQVARIHATRLSLDDVLGKNLPPAPSNPDSSIAGVDANRNGIRDDVELAIFKEYPNSAKTRAVLLQYALAT